MAIPVWDIIEYPNCLRSCVWGWRELREMAIRLGGEAAEQRVAFIPAHAGSGLPDTADKAILRTISEAHERGTIIASVCAGSAWIAAAELDRGRTITTHWSLAPALAAMRPDLKVLATELVIDHGDIISAGGMTAWVDLGLRLVERAWGKKTADDCARTLVWDRGMTRQTGYSPPAAPWVPLRADPVLAEAVEWIGKRFLDRVRLEDWAEGARLGTRTLQRRWTAAYGAAPVEWLQRVRVGEARRRLESGAQTWEAITAACGYGDPAAFRRVFEREIGCSPGRYRTRGGGRRS